MAGPPDTLGLPGGIQLPGGPDRKGPVIASGTRDGLLGCELVAAGEVHRVVIADRAVAAAAGVVNVQVATRGQHLQRVGRVAERGLDHSVVRRGAGAVDSGSAANGADGYRPMNLRDGHARDLRRLVEGGSVERHLPGDRQRDGDPHTGPKVLGGQPRDHTRGYGWSVVRLK